MPLTIDIKKLKQKVHPLISKPFVLLKPPPKHFLREMKSIDFKAACQANTTRLSGTSNVLHLDSGAHKHKLRLTLKILQPWIQLLLEAQQADSHQDFYSNAIKQSEPASRALPSSPAALQVNAEPFSHPILGQLKEKKPSRGHSPFPSS